jgi:hypothetical protein
VINEDLNVRRNFTLPRELYEELQYIARELSRKGPGKVNVSDLIVDGARRVVEEYRRQTDGD